MPLAAGLYSFYHAGGNTDFPPVILIHGAGADHLAWPPEIRRLPGLRVHALDLPGHGKSSGSGRQAVEDYTRVVVDFMDAAGIWRAFITGHSLGGAIALTLALDLPERIAGLCLVSSGARLPVPPALLEDASSPSTYARAARELQALSSSENTPPPLAAQNLERLLRLRPTVLHGDLLACDRFDVTERVDTIQTPVLVVCGTADRLLPLRSSSWLAAHIPGAALQTIDDAGHLLMLEQPQRLAKLLSVFIPTVPYIPGA